MIHRRQISRLARAGSFAADITIRSHRSACFTVIAAACIIAFSPFPAGAETVRAVVPEAADPWKPVVDEAAARFAIPSQWIRAVIRVESRGNVRAVSPKGAIGLMQLMPDTYAELRARYGLGDDPADPRDNIIAGAAYLREMHDRFGSVGFIAAYNAGPQRCEDHLATGRPLPDETRAYVAQIMPLLAGGLPTDNRWVVAGHTSRQQPSLFVLHAGPSTNNGSAFSPQATLPRRDHVVADLSALVPLPGKLFVGKSESRGRR